MMQKQHLTYWLVFVLGIGLGAALSAGFADATCPAESKAGITPVSGQGVAPASVHPAHVSARVDPNASRRLPQLTEPSPADAVSAAVPLYEQELLLFVPEQ